MTSNDCRNRIRFSLSDRSGVLRFEDFDIVDGSDGCYMLDQLTKRLLGRPLCEIDVGVIRRVYCPDCGHCIQVVADLIEECQSMFVRQG